MRLLIAMMKHETNTFSPVPTPLARFGHGPGPLYGEAAIRAYRGTGTGLGAYLDLAEREGAEIVLPIAAGAPPSRPVEDAAYRAHRRHDLRGGRRGRLRRHHARPARRDGDREPRGRRGRVPDAASARSTRRRRSPCRSTCTPTSTTRSSTTRRSSTGYRTYPHIDTYETARRAGEILLRTIRGEVRPVMAWGNVPMLPHVMRQGTDDHPNKELQAPLRRDERRGRAWPRACSPAFRMPTSPMPGCSAVVVTDGDRELAERSARRAARTGPGSSARLSSTRSSRCSNRSARAKALPPPKPGEGPIVLLDHYDNCASGGTMDTTAVLAEILRAGARERRRLCDLRPRGGAAGDRRRDRRRGQRCRSAARSRCRRSPARARR